MILTGISLNQIPLDWEGNTKRILESLRFYQNTNLYREYPSHIIVYPELTISGYGCEDGFLFSSTKRESIQKLYTIIKFSQQLSKALIFIGVPFYYRGTLFNCMAVIHGGKLFALIPKTFLAGEGIHYEQRWFTPARGRFRNIEISIGEYQDLIAFGKGLIEFQNIRIGLEICEDSWVANRPALSYYKQDMDILLNPAASHFAFGKYAIRKNLAISSSFQYHCYYFSVNLLGNESGKAIYDGSFFLAKDGEILYETERFSFHDIIIRSIHLQFKELKNKRDRIYSRRKDRKYQSPYHIVRIQTNRTKQPTFEIPEKFQEKHNFEFIIDHKEIYQLPFLNHKNYLYPIELIEFLEVERLGLFDYMRKTNSRGYVISLSGGADSSLCAILVYQMIRRGIIELGLENFIKKINYPLSQKEKENLKSLSKEKQIQYFCKKLIHTIYQKTENNTPRTLEIAQQLSREIQSDHHTIEIQELVNKSIQLLESSLKQKLTWDQHDIALQNIQARIRSPLAWLLANTTQSILIATSNRSEASVGYATMDGDTSGGLAPIAGIDKPFILQFLHFISKYKDEFTVPIATAREILKQSPSAELRPKEKEQTDEKDLMPYPILAMIEKFAIEELLSPDEIYKKILSYKKSNHSKTSLYQYPNLYFKDFLNLIKKYKDPEIYSMIQKFFILWKNNQWKRERFAVSFQIDSYHVDPRGWFRYPVISGKLL